MTRNRFVPHTSLEYQQLLIFFANTISKYFVPILCEYFNNISMKNQIPIDWSLVMSNLQRPLPSQYTLLLGDSQQQQILINQIQ